MRKLAIVLAAVALSACGSTSSGEQPSPSAPAASPSPSQIACTNSGQASADWPAADSSQPGRIATIAASGDVLTITFEKGTPAFTVSPQGTAHFTLDPSGLPIDLQGNAGALITLRGFQTTPSGNFVGQISTSSLGPEVRDVRKIGDFEGVVSIAVGLNQQGCAAVTASGSTLTFHFAATSS